MIASASQKKAVNKYNKENTELINIRVKKGLRGKLTTAATALDLSASSLIKRAVNDYLVSRNFPPVF